MTRSSFERIQKLVINGNIAAAVESAEALSVRAVLLGLDYDVLDANAEAFDQFIERWYAETTTLGRKVDIEAEARGMRITSLCLVDGVADRAVSMYLDVQRRLVESLQNGKHDFEQIADVPEAEVTAKQRHEVDRRVSAVADLT